MNLEQTPNLGPNARKIINESANSSDTSTKLATIQLLGQQIEAHEREIAGRDVSQESDLKNESDLAEISKLKEIVRKLQKGEVVDYSQNTLSEEEEPYLKN